MNFLIDENLPHSVGKIFSDRGFKVEFASESEQLRSQPDEAVFDYAVKNKAVIITRDLRFPNEVSIETLCKEVNRLTKDFSDKDYLNIIIIEPGSLRVRRLRGKEI